MGKFPVLSTISKGNALQLTTSISKNCLKMKMILNAGLIFLVVVSFILVIEGTSLRHAQFCGGNSSTNQATCPSGSVISIVEDTLSVCYKEYCGQNKNNYGQIKMALWESCHGKQECTMDRNYLLTSVCSTIGNVLDFTYRCIYMDHNQEDIVQLGVDSYRNSKANKEIHVISSNYPNDMRERGAGFTYTCSITNKFQMNKKKSLFLQLQRVSLAKDSQLQIEIDGKKTLSLEKKRDDDLFGQNSCEPLTYHNSIKIQYRQCFRNEGATQGSIWITMKANGSLDVYCSNFITRPPGCSWETNENVCIARSVDFSSDKGTLCNCSDDAHPTLTPGGTDSVNFAVIIIGVILVIGLIVCVIVCLLIRKLRKNRKWKVQNDNMYSDTAFPPVNREPMEANLYTEIDLPSSSHYSNIDPFPSVPVRNTQNISALPDPNVQYGFVNKPLKKKRVHNGEEHKMLDNIVDGLTEAEEDETVMQENTELYS